MSDKEILEVLIEMRADYESALCFDGESSLFTHHLIARSVQHGFCNWLKKSISVINGLEVLSELGKDSEKSPTQDRINFFYATTSNFSDADNIKKFVLLPRAKNINRTIERVEKRILGNISVKMPQQI